MPLHVVIIAGSVSTYLVVELTMRRSKEELRSTFPAMKRSEKHKLVASFSCICRGVRYTCPTQSAYTVDTTLSCCKMALLLHEVHFGCTPQNFSFGDKFLCGKCSLHPYKCGAIQFVLLEMLLYSCVYQHAAQLFRKRCQQKQREQEENFSSTATNKN